MTRSPFSTAAFAQLIRRLRHSNARYNQIARQFRCRIRPTHHAKRRAFHAGLRIDTSKARACPPKYISTHPLPVLDRSALSPSSLNPMYATTEPGNAYMRDVPLKNLPEVTVRKCRRADGRQRITLRLPPLKLSLGIDYVSNTPFQESVPGAPRLKPRQLPEEDTVEEMLLESPSSSSSSFLDVPVPLFTPFDVRVYSGLCITLPPRSLKRKLQDVDIDGNLEQPMRVLKARWNESQVQ